MKLTKKRLQKIIHNKGKQTRKKFKKTAKIFKHSNTFRQKKQFNLKNLSLKQITI
jgi:hypothetical protein